MAPIDWDDDDFSDMLDKFDKLEKDYKSNHSSTSSPSASSSKSDVWDTNRGRGKKDRSRIWGTEEYFQRVEKPRDEWDTGLANFSGVRRRIQQNIKADANRIKLNAERIKADARRAAEKIKQQTSQRLSQTRMQAQKDLLKDYDFTAKTKTKPKRRWKLSGKGITIGGSIFWCFILYTCLFDNDDDKDTKARVADTTTSNDVVEKVKETYNNLKPEAQALIDKAKNEYERVIVKKDGKHTTAVNKMDNSDRYKQSDDRYGSTDDKW